MKIDYQAFYTHALWRADNALSQLTIPTTLRPWLTDRGSLTSALLDLSAGEFGVNLLSQRIIIPAWHEQKKLHRPWSRAAMVREVELKIYEEAVVYARSVIPLALVLKGRSGLANLGRKPLGHLLFKDGRIRVSKREFAGIDVGGVNIQARRTPYDYMGSRILVSEFFLPKLSKYL